MGIMEHVGEYRGDKPEELYTELRHSWIYSLRLRIDLATFKLVTGNLMLVSTTHRSVPCNPNPVH